MPATTDELTEALRALCTKLNPEVVADTADLSAENIKQILAGTKLKSGNPRGVGPKTRRHLDTAYPNWLTDYRAKTQPPTLAPTILQTGEPPLTYLHPPKTGPALEVIGMALAKMPAEHRTQLIAELKMWVEFGGQEIHRLAVDATLNRLSDPTQKMKTGT